MGKDTSENGLELDKINLSQLSPTSVDEPKPKSPPPPPIAEEETFREKKRFRRLTLIIAPAVLAALICLIVIFKQQNFSFGFLSGKTGSSVESYLRVGPISATLANEDIINFSLDIDCGSEALKERLAGKDSQLRDRILSVITAPGTEELLETRQYAEIKAKIKESLGDVTSEPIGDIYFADIIVY